MIYPQEIEVWYILPAIRREIAKHLIDSGLKQKEVALKLGVTEAAVSQYMKDKRANEIVFDVTIKKAIERAAKRLVVNDDIMREITKINNAMRKNNRKIVARRFDFLEFCFIAILLVQKQKTI